MRISLRRKPWLFWGERLANRGGWHEALAAPLHRASGIVGIGTLATQDYARRYPEPKHFNIPYCCAVDPFLRSERERHEGTVFLFCGQMIRRKGVDILLEAFSRLRGNARLLLVGREAELPGLLAPLPAAVRERIEYAGFQAPEALPRFFARADVFVLPSRYDGWGVVVNQAIAAGLPLVCSDTVGAAYDLLDPWVNGLRIPPGDPGLLAEAMQHFVDVPGLAAAWGLASRIQAHRFTPQAGASRWVDVLSELTQAG